MRALLRTRRWIGFTALVAFVIVAFGLLSLWQWHRAEEKRTERLALEASMSRPPVDLDTTAATPPEWQHVTLSGTYEPSLQVLVRRRPMNATNGFLVMTPLETSGGATVWVNRGWLPATGDALATQDAPAPPGGEVTVTGYVREFDDSSPDDNAGLPAGQVAAAGPETLPAVVDGYGAYVQLAEGDAGLVAWALPDVDDSRNISYAIQWLLFAAVAMAGWFFFLRREAREDAERERSDTWT